MAKVIGIDLGTANSVVCLKSKGIVLHTPTVVAVNKADGEIVAVDEEARRMLGKAPAGIDVVKPLKNGVISHPKITSQLIRGFFEYTRTLSLFSRPIVIICVPYNVTELEKQAVEDAVFEAGARSVGLIEEPLAAAIGIGLQIQKAGGHALVDIGGGTTEVSILNLGGVVVSRDIKIGGEAFDEAIISYLRRRRGIRIGESQAEKLKIAIGSAHKTSDRGEMEVSGLSLENGLAVRMKIQSSEIREAISPCLEQIGQTIQSTLEQTSPELSSDIFTRGLILTGGGALMPGMDRFIADKTKLNVRIAPKPLYSVCLGIHKIIESDGNMEKLLQARGR